jgi:hypothetical protein
VSVHVSNLCATDAAETLCTCALSSSRRTADILPFDELRAHTP